MEYIKKTRTENGAKKIRNEVELIVLLYGCILDFDYIYSKFEISEKTFKRDINSIRQAIIILFDEDARLIKIKNKLAYKLYLPQKPILLL